MRNSEPYNNTLLLLLHTRLDLMDALYLDAEGECRSCFRFDANSLSRVCYFKILESPVRRSAAVRPPACKTSIAYILHGQKTS